MPTIGTTGIILLVIVALLLFGPNKLPELGRAFGRTLREFKKGAKEMIDDDGKERKDAERIDVSGREREEQTSSPNKRLPD